jgi:hypothetical protein
VICNFTDEITYDSPIGDMLNCTEGIANEIKWYFFLRTCLVCKAIGKFINEGLTDRPEITDKHFSK